MDTTGGDWVSYEVSTPLLAGEGVLERSHINSGSAPHRNDLQWRVHRFMEGETREGQWFEDAILVLIFGNVVSFMLSTVDRYRTERTNHTLSSPSFPVLYLIAWHAEMSVSSTG